MTNIVHVTLNDNPARPSTPELALERHKAISDLLVENNFQLIEPANMTGPYHLALTLGQDRLNIGVLCTQTSQTADIAMSLTPMRSFLRDYVIVCESFYKMAQTGDQHRLEAIDMGRRGIHNDGADMLIETLENKVRLDKMTARRLFSLLYVLHIRTTPT